MSEIWRPVVGFEKAYEVSDQGRVRSIDRSYTKKTKGGAIATVQHKGRVLKPGFNVGGYLIVGLYYGGENRSRPIHSIVAEAFIGTRPVGLEVRHLDGNKLNCRAENLKYATHTENEADKRKHGTLMFGEKSVSAVLSENDVRRIREMRGVPQQELADMFGCTFSNISAIQLRKSWKHVD